MDEYDLSYLYKIEIILYTFICSVNINIPPGQFIFFEIAADILKYGHIITYYVIPLLRDIQVVSRFCYSSIVTTNAAVNVLKHGLLQTYALLL